jgi:type II secretion system protein N
MNRIVAFVALLIVFVVWTFPHRDLVERTIASKLANTDVVVTFDSVRPSWPPGYRLGGVRIDHGAYGAELDELRLAVNPFVDKLRFYAHGCGGSIVGMVGREDDKRILVTRFSDIDPSLCTKLDAIVVASSMKGRLELDGLGMGKPSGVIGRAAASGALRIDAGEGTVSGHLPAAPGVRAADGGAGIAIGSWKFDAVRVEAHVEDGRDVVVDLLTARAEGVEWRIAPARLAANGRARPSLSASLRARRLDTSNRSKAILGLLPKAGESEDGWRRYRVTGTLDAPQMIGLR